VREVFNEIKEIKRDDDLEHWAKDNRDCFHDPTRQELEFITEIYRVNHFRQNLEKKRYLHGGSFADPFIIAKASVEGAIVVTQEQYKEGETKIPNICQHFSIQYLDLKGLLRQEKWVF